MADRFNVKLEADIVRAYQAGEGGRVLERRFGIGASSVYRVLRRHGIDVRERSRRPNRFTPEVEMQIAEYYANGRTSSHVAELYDCSPALVREIARRRGVHVREHGGQLRRWSDAERQDMVARYLAGDSQEAIAKHYGTSQTGVSRILQDIGVTRRRGRGRWKGGRAKMTGGYVGVVVADNSPYAGMRMVNGGYVMEHRLVMAQQLGRPLTKREHVHHINGDRTDNRPENLQLRHGPHGKGQALVCADCGSHNIVHAPLEAPN